MGTFFYPACCAGCGKELARCENLLCSDCIAQLPFIGYENQTENPIFLNLAGRVPIEYAVAIFDFKKQGIIQQIMHHLKYDNRPEIGYFLGQIAGERLLGATCFEAPDFIVPVPLHRKKQRKRGYNQSLCIAQGIGLSFPNATVTDKILLKVEQTSSQTKKNRISRWENVKDSFSLSEQAKENPQLHGKHFLLVDDVLTTGATLESCAHQLLKIPEASLSVAAIATPL